MIALDTNVLVRLITRDDPAEAEAAAEVMRSGTLWLPKTVILELVWVLAYSYELDRASIVLALSKLMGLRDLQVEDATAVALAVGCYERGMDFADALHLASSDEAAELVTFDRKLASKARALGGLTPVRLLGSD
jgi:predicted nucleic-acid-binding protein